MKKTGIVLLLLLVAFATGANSQDLSVVITPGTGMNLNVCAQNQMNFDLSGTANWPSNPIILNIDMDIIDAVTQVSIQMPCSPGGPNVTDPAKIMNLLPYGINIISQSTNGSLLTIEFDVINPSNCGFNFDVSIDCSVIPAQTNANPIHHLFKLNSAVPGAFTVNTSTIYQESRTVLFPFIDPNAPTYSFVGGYMDQVVMEFEFENTGFASAHLNFYFDNTDLIDCGAVAQNAVTTTYFIDNIIQGTITPGTWVTTVAPIPVGGILKIRQTFTITGCLTDPADPCTNNQIAFRWQCADADTEPSMCTQCQQNYFSPYSLTYPPAYNEQITITKTPVTGVPHVDYSCTDTYTPWQYTIENTGNATLQHMDVRLAYGQFWPPGNFGIDNLTLIDQDDVSIDLTDCPGCSLVITDIRPWNSTTNPLLNALCSDAIDDPINGYRFSVYNMEPGDKVVVNFQTYRCCDEDERLFNLPKAYNLWTLNAIPINECNEVVTKITSPNSFYGAAQYWLSQQVTGNINMPLTFTPTVTDLTVPPGTPAGQAGQFGDFTVFTSGLAQGTGHQQLLGQPQSGILRAIIRCDAGLRVEDPLNDVSFTSFDGQTTLPILSCESSIAPPTCTDGEFVYYFDLGSAAAMNIATNGRFNFRLTSCCPSGATPEYTVSFSIHFNDDNCGNLAVSNNSSAPCSTDVSCTACCWLPLNQTGHQIHVHCPGCLAPGIIVQDYKLTRKSFGYPDANNDGIADNNTTITPTYSNFGMIDRFSSHNGDILEDRMVSWFFDGDPGSNGYSYPQDMVPGGAIMNFLQLDRIIPEMATNRMNIEIESIELFVDVPHTDNSQCFECDDFYSNTQDDKRTIQKKCIPAGDIANFVQEDENANRFFFTFPANYLQGTINDCMTSPSFTEFMTDQFYRMRVTYRVCGNILPASVTPSADDVRTTSDISNRMWLSGTQQSMNVWDVGILGNDNNFHTQMPNDLTLMDNWGYFSNGSPLFNQDFANDFLFYCETYGGIHFFNSVFSRNAHFNVDTAGCGEYLDMYSRTYVGTGVINTYPFEYRSTPVSVANATFQTPAGWQVTNIQYCTRYLGNVFSAFQQITQSFPVSGPVTVTAAQTPQTDCLLAGNSGNQSIHKGEDSFITQIYRYTFVPSGCTPGAAQQMNNNSYITDHTVNNNVCTSTIPSTGCQTPLSIIRDLWVGDGYFTFRQPNPNLQVLFTNPIQTATTNTICWSFEISNPQVQGMGFTNAPNVYFEEPGLTFLSNWQMTLNGGAPFSSVNGIFQIDNNLVLGEQISGTICAEFIDCGISPTFEIDWGSNCGGYPNGTPGQIICPTQSSTLGITQTTPLMSAVPVTPTNTSFTPCVDFDISAQFNSLNLGAVYPNLIGINQLPPGLVATACTLSFPCLPTPTNSVVLNPVTTAGYDNSWEITAADLQNILVSNNNDGMAQECVLVTVTLEPGCNYNGQLPEITMEANNYCMDPYQPYETVSMPYTMTPSGNNACTNCFSCDSLSMTHMPKEDCEVSFNAVIPNNPYCTSSTVSWDFGDNSYASGSSVSHVYSAGGTYVVCFKYMCFNNEIPVDSCMVCDTIIVDCKPDTFCLKIPKYADTDTGEGIMTTADGGFVVAATLHKLPQEGNDPDMYFVKYDANMNQEYFNRIGDYGKAYYEFGHSVLVQPDGYFIAGTVIGDGGNEDVFVAKVDLNGQLQSSFRFGSVVQGRDGAHKIIDMSSGSERALLVVGYTQTTNGDLNMLALKINPVDLSIMAYNSYYKVGLLPSEETGYDAVKTGIHTMTDHYAIVGEQYEDYNDKNVMVVNINTNLSLLNGNIYFASNRSETGYGIAANSGSLFITGSSSPIGGPKDLFILKLSAFDLSEQTHAIYNRAGGTSEEGRKIKVDTDEKLIIAGINEPETPGLGTDAFIARFMSDNTLSPIWSKSTNLEMYNEKFKDVEQYDGTRYIATGSYVGTGFNDEDIFVSMIDMITGSSCCLSDYPLQQKKTNLEILNVEQKKFKFGKWVHGEFPPYGGEEYICPVQGHTKQSNLISPQTSEIRIYPNPTSGSFLIELESESYSPCEIRLTDISGRLVKQIIERQTDVRQFDVDASDLQSGIYFVEVIRNGQRFKSKLMISK